MELTISLSERAIEKYKKSALQNKRTLICEIEYELEEALESRKTLALFTQELLGELQDRCAERIIDNSDLN